jgi:hypothetical protein
MRVPTLMILEGTGVTRLSISGEYFESQAGGLKVPGIRKEGVKGGEGEEVKERKEERRRMGGRKEGREGERGKGWREEEGGRQEGGGSQTWQVSLKLVILLPQPP